MAAYEETLDALKTKLLEYLKRSENSSSQEPLTFSLLNSLRKSVLSYTKQMNLICNKIKPQEQSYTSAFDSLSKEYSKKEKELEAKLRKDTQDIISKYDDKINTLKDEIKEKEREIHFEENNILMDIEFFIMASDQNKEMFEAEYNENVSRFNYQIQIASDSYSENTIRFNDLLSKEIEKLEEKYKISLIDYDKDTERIISHYQKNVDELNQILAKKIDDFNKFQAQKRQKKVKESMEFNDKIRALVSLRNEKNQEARNEYARKQAEAQETKESKRQQYQMESQKISKEFVLNMTALDDRISTLKKEFNDAQDQEKRALEYRLLELKKEEEKLLHDLYTTSTSSKKSAKKIKSEYYGYQEIERKNTDKALSHLEKAYLANSEKTNYQKKLLDLDRTFNMKFIVENETYDNKKFQEINNEFEIDMNHAVQINDLEYNREANKLRSENNLKTLKEERNFDEADALHQIETEKLICQIKSIKYEIASFEEIQKLLHKFESDKFTTTINFKTVNNLLEVEKCKVLDTLNKSMYNLNVKSSKMVLDTSNKAIDLKNKEYEQKGKAKIKRNRMVLNTEQKLVEYQIESFKRDKALELAVLNRNFFFELDTLGHDFLASKFELEYKNIMGNLSILTEIITMIHYMETDLLKILYDNVSTRPEYKEVVWPFINELLSIIFQGYQRALSIFHDTTDTMIHERIEFEETLKYKGFYKNIEANYKGELSGFIDRKEYYLKQINDVSAQLENNKGLLFSLDNDLYARRKNAKRTGNYDSELKEIQDTTLQYHDVENENLRLSKKLLVLQKEVSRIDNQISQVNLSYTRQQDEIKKMQMTNAQSYFELEKSLERHISSSIADMNVKLREQDIDSNEFQNSISIVKDRNEAFLRLSLDFIEGVYQIMDRFSNNEQDAIIKSAEILEAGYKTDLSELDRDDKNERANAKAIYIREDQARQEEIIRFDKDVIQDSISMKQSISNHDALVKKLTQNIQEEMTQANQTFYQDYYAICDNQKDVVDKHAKDIKNLETEYQRNRVIIFDRFKKSKAQLKSMLEEYISSRNEILQHLPIAEKENEKAFHLDDIKKSIELDETYQEIKTKSTTSMKEVLKNMDLIKAAFDSKQAEIERNHKMSKQKERRNHQAQLRRI